MSDTTPEFLRNLADRVVPPREAERLRSIADRLDDGFIEFNNKRHAEPDLVRPEAVDAVKRLTSPRWTRPRSKLCLRGGTTITVKMKPSEVRERLQ